MPQWSEADQTLAKALQKEIGAKVDGLKTEVKKLEPPKEPGGVSDDIGDISWNVPMVYLIYPANIPNLPGHSWENAVAMATPLAHKGSLAGAKVQALTALDYPASTRARPGGLGLLQRRPDQGPEVRAPHGRGDLPAVEMNKERMERFLPELKKRYYDPAKYRTYLEQLGIKYPTVRERGLRERSRPASSPWWPGPPVAMSWCRWRAATVPGEGVRRRRPSRYRPARRAPPRMATMLASRTGTAATCWRPTSASG